MSNAMLLGRPRRSSGNNPFVDDGTMLVHNQMRLANFSNLLALQDRITGPTVYVDNVNGRNDASGSSWISARKDARSVMEQYDNQSVNIVIADGTHPEFGDVRDLAGGDRNNIMSLRAANLGKVRISSNSTTDRHAIMVGKKCCMAMAGFIIEHPTYRDQANTWGGTRSNFGITVENGIFDSNGREVGMHPNAGPFWCLNNIIRWFGHGAGGYGTPVSIFAGNIIYENAWWVTGGGSGLSMVRLAGNTWNEQNQLNWDDAPIFVAPDGVQYHFVQIANYIVANEQKIASRGIGKQHKSDGNGGIFGDSRAAWGRCLQALNITAANGGQGVNAYDAANAGLGVDQVMNTSFLNGQHWYRDDGIPTSTPNGGGLYTASVTVGTDGAFGSNALRAVQRGNLVHPLERSAGGVIAYNNGGGGLANVSSTNNINDNSDGRTSRGGINVSDLGLVNEVIDVPTLNAELTASSPARGALLAGVRKTPWDALGRPLPTSGIMDAGAFQYA